MTASSSLKSTAPSPFVGPIIIDDEKATRVRDVALRFVNELIEIFEQNKPNEYVYRRLILMHHKIANVYETVDIRLACDYLLRRCKDRVAKRDPHLLRGTSFEFDAESVWCALSARNRERVWHWVDTIVRLCAESALTAAAVTTAAPVTSGGSGVSAVVHPIAERRIADVTIDVE